MKENELNPPGMSDDRTVILIVDDDQVSIHVLSEILGGQGYAIRTATDPATALQDALSDPPDLILLDIRMPEMDGITFCQRLKKDARASHVPVIFISTLDEPKDKVKAFEAGGVDYLTKPLYGPEILIRVRNQLNLHRLQGWLKQLVGQRTAELETEITERKMIEAALKKTKARHEEAQRIAHLGHWAIDLLNNELSWSDECYHIFGVELGTPETYEAFLEAVHPDDRELVDRTYTDSVKNRTSYDIEHRLLMKDGSIKWVNDRCKTHYTEDGAPLRSLGTVLDITRRKKVDEKLQSSFVESIDTLMRAAEYRDDETGTHVRRISYYTKVLAEKLGMDDEFCDTIFYASAMHDIGKIGTPDHILLKPGGFTPEESEIMKAHTTIGGGILSGYSSPYLQMGEQIALAHHERWDGSGYPLGLKGDAIPLPARIMQLADVYDALRSKRPYKEAFDHAKSLEIITKGDDRTDPSHFAPEVLAVFQGCADTLAEIFEKMLSDKNK